MLRFINGRKNLRFASKFLIKSKFRGRKIIFSLANLLITHLSNLPTQRSLNSGLSILKCEVRASLVSLSFTSDLNWLIGNICHRLSGTISDNSR